MKNKFDIDGNFWINKNEKAFIGKGRVELLKNIQIYGSISKAAKQMKMSYKAAWDSVDIMNKLSQEPLVTKVTGGVGGGGTVITTYAKEIINAYDELKNLHETYLENMSNLFDSLVIDLKNEKPVFSKLEGKITNIISNNQNSEIEIILNSKQKLVTIVNEEFLQKRELKIDKFVKLLIETNSIVITKDKSSNSARNSLEGVVEEINDDGISTYLSINCGESDFINAKITNSSYKTLSIKKQDKVFAFFKAYNINII
ncbi:TOBE domain-containing protein [Arcobacter sp.]|uniref:TOBE domain-containing protein n=1 Tax=Arcobacter sp. TaxID=1872629 RepID=UPI003D122ECB